MNITIKAGQVWHITEAGKKFFEDENLSIADGGELLTVDNICLPEDGDMMAMMTGTTLGYSKGMLHKGESSDARADRFAAEITADPEKDINDYSFDDLRLGYTFIWSSSTDDYFELETDVTTH